MSDQRSPWERDQDRPYARVAAKVDEVRRSMLRMPDYLEDSQIGDLIGLVSLLADAVETLNDRAEDESDPRII